MVFFCFLSFVTYNHLKQNIQSYYNHRLSPVTCMPTNCPHFVLIMSLWCFYISFERHSVTYNSFQQGTHSKQPQSILYNMPTNCVQFAILPKLAYYVNSILIETWLIKLFNPSHMSMPCNKPLLTIFYFVNHLMEFIWWCCN